MATCICKQIISCPQIPIIYNGVSVHNPKNVDACNINYRLINKYCGIFDKSYTECKFQWVRQKMDLTNFNRIELLTVHSYDHAILEKKDERSMKNVRLVGMKKQQLHSMQDYIDALKIILESSDNTHLNGYVAPVVADWPGQLFIRKALVHLHIQEQTARNSIPPNIQSFIPILGPLHVSLNSREQVMLVHYSFFKLLFHFLFGERVKLAKKPKPWRINLLLELAYSGWIKIRTTIKNKFGSLCKDIEYQMLLDLLDNLIPATLDIYAILFRSGSFDEYVETIFRIWTFALRWKRKNYNKAPLVFLSDIFYWEDINHPFLEAMKMFLPNFNDYPVENMHSKIRTSISINASAEDIIKQACIIGKLCKKKIRN